MTKSYADQCLERAEKATKGPWSTLEEEDEVHAIKFIEACGDPLHIAQSIGKPENAEFISHARTDVPELARRLKKSIFMTKSLVEQIITTLGADQESIDEIVSFIDQLEAPLGEENKI